MTFQAGITRIVAGKMSVLISIDYRDNGARRGCHRGNCWWKNAYGCSPSGSNHGPKRQSGDTYRRFMYWTGVTHAPRVAGCDFALTYRGSRDAFVPYFTSKTAVVALTESLALELAPEVLVNAVAPRPILMPPGLSPTENDEVIDATPFRR